MKTKKLFVAAVATLFSMAAFAANDITPGRYVFANQEVGQYKIDYVFSYANPGVSVIKGGWDNGYVLLGGAAVAYFPGPIDPAKNANAHRFQEGMNIIDLGGSIGKVLCIRGPESTLEHGTKINSAWTTQWANLNFVLDSVLTPIDETCRIRIVYNQYHNTPGVGHSLMAKHYMSTAQNAAPDNSANSALPNDTQTFFEIDEDTEEMAYDITTWIAREIDFKVPETIGNPTRLKIEMHMGNLRAGTLFIKEISITKNNTTEVVEQAKLKFTPGATSLNDVKLRNLSIMVIGNELHLQDVAKGTPVSVYTSLGQQIANLSYKGDAITLNKGIYIVRAGTKTAKVIVQ